MKLLVFGNVGSGKSTLISLTNSLLNWSVIAIDDFRRKYGDGSQDAELIVRKKFFAAIKPGINQIIECTGVGGVGKELFALLEDTEDYKLVILLKTPGKISAKRITSRSWRVPFPKPQKNVYDFMAKTEELISAGFIEKLWQPAKNTDIMVKQNHSLSEFKKIQKEVLSAINKRM